MRCRRPGAPQLLLQGGQLLAQPQHFFAQFKIELKQNLMALTPHLNSLVPSCVWCERITRVTSQSYG